MLQRFLLLLLLFLPAVESYGTEFSCLKVELEQLTHILYYNGFAINRTIDHYKEDLGAEFKQALDRLGPADLWIDFGAGTANALATHLRALRKSNSDRIPNMLGIVYSRPHQVETENPELKSFVQSGKVQYWAGRYVEDIPWVEFPRMTLGTDFFGPLSYTPRLSELLRKYLSVMEVDHSRLFVILGEAEPYPTKIIPATGGEPLALSDWLKTLPGIEVKTVRVSPGAWKKVALEIKRTSEKIRIPQLELVEMTAGSPPLRTFRVISGSALKSIPGKK